MKQQNLIVSCFLATATTIIINSEIITAHALSKRALQKSHEKLQSDKWQDTFFGVRTDFDQTSSLVNLLGKIALEYLAGCTAVILYDNFTERSDNMVLGRLLKTIPISYVHGQISGVDQVQMPLLIRMRNTCVSYIVFMQDVMKCRSVIGDQNHNKVIIIARSSQWRVYEFLSSEVSQSFINLLVIAKSEKVVSMDEELPYILYTHKLFIDGLGSSIHQVLTSWSNSSLTRPHISLFPKKIVRGFSGHRFIVSLAHQPPFVIKKGTDDNDDVEWDGIEVRLVKLLSSVFNFTTDFREAKDADTIGSTEAVTETMQSKRANLGIAGLYVTEELLSKTDMSLSHSQDCASFVSLTSTALPRYRAIMGPFHWSVWLALTCIYLFAMLPLAFSHKHTLRHLIESPEEIENMFWYVFGTFTNSFSFLGKGSWSQSNKMATRLLIGFYWLFTIIITACYTGSIIAFVTLPVYPSTIDTPKQFLSGNYRIGILDAWQHWFKNLTNDPIAEKLFKNVDLVPNIESGLKNTTKAFFWPYSFMGSKSQLDYIVRTNFTKQNKRSLLHISSECFVPFGVSLIYKKNSIYSGILDMGVLYVIQSGFHFKLKSDVEWYTMRSASGKLLAANSYGNVMSALRAEDRALTLDDTQGMFLLLGAGFILGGMSLLFEWLGGCVHIFKRKNRDSNNIITTTIMSNNSPSSSSIASNRQSYDSINLGGRKTVECAAVAVVVQYNNCNNEPRQNDDNIETEISKLFDFNDVFGRKNSNIYAPTDSSCKDCSVVEE